MNVIRTRLVGSDLGLEKEKKKKKKKKGRCKPKITGREMRIEKTGRAGGKPIESN